MPALSSTRSALAPTDQPARCIAWLCTTAAADRAGPELDIRDPALKKPDAS